MQLPDVLVYLLGKIEELGYLAVNPVSNFFLAGYPNAAYVVYMIGAAFLGGVTWLVISKYFVEHAIANSNNATKAEKTKSLASLFSKYWMVVAFALIFHYLLGVLALFLITPLLQRENYLLPLAVAGIVFPPLGMYIAFIGLVATGTVSPIFWLGQTLSRFIENKTYAKRVVLATIAGYVFISLAVMMSVVVEMSWDGGGADAHHVHAIVKNTCVIVQQVNCPQNIEGLAMIEDKFFQNIQGTHQVFYKYYPDQNHYVLLVRYDKHEALLFSQLLKSANEIGNVANDFKLMRVETFGKDRVENMPEFAKEFEYLPEWDKR